MKQVILKKDKILQNEYVIINDLKDLSNLNSQKIIITVEQWLANKNILKKRKNIGIKLNSDESISMIKDDIDFFKMIQFNFITFKDGRPFSEAKKLRVEFKFLNEIRASGHILPDQYIFLLRCGFSSVEIETSKKKFWLEFLEMDSGLYYQP
tara:strand:+ start:164 stop:619 length:456 start_codon:yes stop_codon:yes gene_type:complete